ncbi:riboflavin synthase subunit alpha [Sansalvadorimonas verongulae]|uniref:riboflavin synthase subunit alpha n=1 Tax=Sansalvadorimonas verongulae TaxID=2172824 RepID=UPI0012BC3578|nr:riboflavin synthase subunit alpha [Sansalvadorimonas verongulae]MTI13882.1 riboflavin synthase subunit alpha [Sansalvadorimonas verongulae]
MFTGIVQGTREVVFVERRDKFASFEILLGHDLATGLQAGASVSINGVCLTVTQCSEDCATFDVMQETLRVTNLNGVQAGDLVNVERAARVGDEVGGHNVSGHVTDVVTVLDVVKTPDNTTISFQMDSQWKDYLLPKGYVALNGASLTIGAEVKDQTFAVHLIPETLRTTTFAQIKPGMKVNLEIDPQTQAIVDTVKSFMKQQQVA